MGAKARGRRARRLTALSVFSGIGGMDLGLGRAGFQILGAVEIDPVARASFALNLPGTPLLSPPDVTELATRLSPSDLGLRAGDLTVLAGGPPCQPFSKAALWAHTAARGVQDPRARCLESFLALAETLLPEAILIENVPGFARGPRAALTSLEAGLNRINRRHGTAYRPETRILNAVDFGVPQRRERAIVVALRDGGSFGWPAPTHAGRPVTAWDALHDVDVQDVPRPSGRYAALLPAVPEGCNYLHFTDRGSGPVLFGYRRRYWSFLLKLAKAQPSWTIPAHPGPSTGPFHWESRPLAAAEMLRLQSFPHGWRLKGSHREQVRQAGNATPPLLAEVLALALRAHLRGGSTASPTLTVPRAARIPPPEPPAPVPVRYQRECVDHAPHPGSGRGPAPRTLAA